MKNLMPPLRLCWSDTGMGIEPMPAFIRGGRVAALCLLNMVL
ncbi:MAG: hypothetical protein RIC37_13125 [Gammaproteobacteria bacterium]